jgi:protein-arginine kinase activator protein McsA
MGHPDIFSYAKWIVRHTGWRMAGTKRSRAKKQVFSVTKAVKANARAQVGQPPAAFVLPDDTKTARSARKHKKSLQDLIDRED